MKKLEEMAEKWAKQCVQTRGNPHWHDVRDAFLAGHASRDAEVEKLRAVAEAAREIENHSTDCDYAVHPGRFIRCTCGYRELSEALAALNSEKGEGK